MKSVPGIFTAITVLVGCTPALVGQSQKWNLIVKNMADTRRNIRQLLKRKQLYGDATRLDGRSQRGSCQRWNSQDQNYCISVLREITWAKNMKRKPTDEANKSAKNLQHPPRDLTTRQLRWKPEVPTRNFIVLLRPNGTESGHWDDVDDTTERQQHQSPSR
jgi:hypothetical protein